MEKNRNSGVSINQANFFMRRFSTITGTHNSIFAYTDVTIVCIFDVLFIF